MEGRYGAIGWCNKLAALGQSLSSFYNYQEMGVQQGYESDRVYTYDQYETLLLQSQTKLEYIDGKIRTMAGASENHLTVRDNLQIKLTNLQQRCRVKGSDLAVFITAQNKYYYPDLTVICDEKPLYTDRKIAQLLNPTLIVEVLSESTDGTDRGEKFHAYFSLPSIQEYVLVDSQRIRVDVFYREAASTWSMRSYYAPEQRVHLQSLKLDVPVGAIYADTDLL